jgi:hypothetical protein
MGSHVVQGAPSRKGYARLQSFFRG